MILRKQQQKQLPSSLVVATLVVSCLAAVCSCSSFTATAFAVRPSQQRRHFGLFSSTTNPDERVRQQQQEQTSSSSSSEAAAALQSLTPELRRLAEAFTNIGDDKLRYKQLLYMANHDLPPLANPTETMVASNKVPGCLSTVYIDATATSDATQDDKYVVDFVGDSDGLLTKGLVALLVRGLSGCTAEEIQKVDPSFIKEAKISQSLTPGRNNGFLNMLQVMKQKAIQATETAKAEAKQAEDTTTASSSTSSNDETTSADSDDNDNDRPMYKSMMESLAKLQPSSLTLVDTSYQHAGHAGAKGLDGESHFELTIVADAFDGLNLIKRHQLVYMILQKEMPHIHALSIKANTPSEVEQ